MKFHLKYLLLFGLLAFGFHSCTDDFEELNTNPTQAVTIDPALQLTRVELTTSNNRYEHWRAQYIYSSTIIQHNACSFSYWSGDKYNMIDSYASAQWDSDYPRGIKNVVDLVNRTSEDPFLVNFNAAARITKVFLFHRLTDLYGDLPYFNAGQGFINGVLFPEYDRQEDVYNDFFKELDEASKSFNPDARPLEGDFWLGNDIDKWKKFANSLRLRLAFRLQKVDPARAQQEVQAAIAGGVMESIDDSVIAEHTDLETNGNSDVMVADDNYRMSDVMVDLLKATGDPRLPIWGMTYDDDGNPQPDVSTWEGLPNGTDGNSPEFERLADFVRHNRSTIRTPSAQMFHLMHSEVEFRLAEAAVRGWGAPLSAAEHFERGLRSAAEQVALYPNASIDPADIDAFVAANPLDESSTEAALEHINTQLWVSFYQNAIEAFANWRASGYPELTPVNHPIGTTGGTIPRRLYYPTSENGLNPNYNDAVARQFPDGNDDLTGRVWWDVEN